MLLSPALHLPLRIYINVLIIFIAIFSDGLIYAKILEHFVLTLDQLQCAKLLILSDVPYAGFNEA